MRYCILILTVMLLNLPAQALEVVYPKNTEVTIASPTTFFIGNSKPDKPLNIKGKPIDVHKSGGFAYPVELNTGMNEFVIESENEKQIFKIKRLDIKQSTQTQEPAEVEFDEPKYFKTSRNNVPLRTTPVDAGINRLAHFQEGIPLKAIGEKQGFYKIELSPAQTAWIAKTNVTQAEEFTPARLIRRASIYDENKYIFKIDFDKKIPYSIEEGNSLIVKFYGVNGYKDKTYKFSFPIKKKLAGYSGYFEGNSFILKIRKFPQIDPQKPLKGIKIVIDAGHGGKEVGAIGCLGHKEKDINLMIAKSVATELKARGANVVMTRTSDEDVTLAKRVEITNQNDAMIFLSIHGNALPDSQNPLTNTGTSIYYYYNQAKPLADKILTAMTTQLPFANDKVRQGSLAVVRNTEALSILIEVGYLINPEDNSNLINREIHKKSGKAIADGISKFLTDSPPEK